jgi:hypothetical protein
MAKRAHAGEDFGLTGITPSSGMSLDGPHRHPLVWDLMVLAPGCESRKESAIGVRSIDSEVSPDLLKINRAKARG